MHLLLLADEPRLIEPLASALATHGCHLTLDPSTPVDLCIVDLDRQANNKRSGTARILTIGTSPAADVRKPFSIAELISRLCVLARQAGADRPDRLICGDLVLDAVRHTVQRSGVPIELAPREFAVLEHLMRHAGCPVTRMALLRHAWPFDYEGSAQVVDVCIRRLRAKVDDSWQVQRIRTLRGIGYCVPRTNSR